MKQLSTICGAAKHAALLYHRCDTGQHEKCQQLVDQLMEIIENMWDMGQRMEDRLREYRDFCHDLQEKLNVVRRNAE